MFLSDRLTLFGFVPLALALLGFAPAALGAAASLPVDSSVRYAKCLALATSSPVAAMVEADSWAKQGGGDGAAYCAAVALLSAGRYEEAASRLDGLGQGLSARNPALAAGLLAEAGQAWSLAGDTDRALASQGAALKLAPNDVELALDRAVTLGGAKKYWEALDDLNHAHDLAPKRADIFVLRATAYRYLESYDLANENIEEALKIAPDDPQALLERGSIRKATGDLAGARRDWVDAARLAGEDPVAEAARLNLEQLDVKSSP